MKKQEDGRPVQNPTPDGVFSNHQSARRTPPTDFAKNISAPVPRPFGSIGAELQSKAEDKQDKGVMAAVEYVGGVEGRELSMTGPVSAFVRGLAMVYTPSGYLKSSVIIEDVEEPQEIHSWVPWHRNWTRPRLWVGNSKGIDSDDPRRPGPPDRHHEGVRRLGPRIPVVEDRPRFPLRDRGRGPMRRKARHVYGNPVPARWCADALRSLDGIELTRDDADALCAYVRSRVRSKDF